MADTPTSDFAVLDTPLAGGDAAPSAPEPTAAPEPTVSAPSDAKASVTPEATPGPKEPAAAPTGTEPVPVKAGEPEAPAPDALDQALKEFVEGLEPQDAKDFLQRHPTLSADEKRLIKKWAWGARELQKIVPYDEAKEFRQTFPSKQDWQTAAQASEAFYKAASDFESDPTTFAGALRNANPEAYERLADQIAQERLGASPDIALPVVAEKMTEVFSVLEARARNTADENLLTALEIVREQLNMSGESAVAPGRSDPLFQENQRLRAEREEIDRQRAHQETGRYQQLKAHVNGNLFKNALRSGCEQYIEAVKPSGVSEKSKQWAVNDLLSRVGRAFFGTPANTRAIEPMLREALRGNPQYRPDAIVREMLSRAGPLIRAHGPAVLKDWTELVVGESNRVVADAKSRESARKDVGSVATPAPHTPKIDPNTPGGYAEIFANAWK